MERICPFCSKTFDTSLINEETILREIRADTHSLSSLEKKTKISRSTLRYYIMKLEKAKKIRLRKLNNFVGKPVMVEVI